MSALPAGRALRRAAALLAVAGCAAGPAPSARPAVPSAPSEPRCSAGVCSSLEADEAGQVLVVENRGPVVATVSVSYSALENVRPSAPAPVQRTLAAGERATLVRFVPEDPRAATDVRTRVETLLGSTGTVHDDGVRYGAPFGGGAARCVGQGENGGITHVGPRRFAYDFAMPEGTPVVAAREGIVLLVADGHVRGGPDPGLEREANLVVIAHADGTLGRYVHLRPGLAVAPGQRVARGQRLGDSGRTGYASAPHLHFDVGLIEAEVEGYTIPVRFAGADGGAPAAGICLAPAP